MIKHILVPFLFDILRASRARILRKCTIGAIIPLPKRASTVEGAADERVKKREEDLSGERQVQCSACLVHLKPEVGTEWRDRLRAHYVYDSRLHFVWFPWFFS